MSHGKLKLMAMANGRLDCPAAKPVDLFNWLPTPNQTYELTTKEPRKNGPIERTPKKPDRDYLSDEDKLIYDNLMTKIRDAKEAEKEAKRPKPLTEAEKLMRKIEKLQQELAKMSEEGDN